MTVSVSTTIGSFIELHSDTEGGPHVVIVMRADQAEALAEKLIHAAAHARNFDRVAEHAEVLNDASGRPN